MFILDVLQTVDCLAGTVDLLNDRDGLGWRAFWPRDFTVSDVVPAMRSLIKDGMVRQMVFDERAKRLVVADDEDLEAGGDLERFYFRVTDEGMKAWEAWQPPADPTDP